MPELPEVETVRRTLGVRVVGRRVTDVDVQRPDVVRGERSLLRGQSIRGVIRHGKQLAIVGEDQTCICIHLGMSGQLLCLARDAQRPPSSGTGPRKQVSDHVHVVWQLDDGSTLAFRDPRRFGGVWSFTSRRDLHETRWAKLGPDGLLITPGQLHAGLSRTQRALKAALLDQHLVAGLGNIYVDELLFAVGLHPRKLASEITKGESGRLVRALRRLLGRAIEAGGSTLRDYVDAEGQAGGYQTRHRVYGRGGQPCRRCRTLLETMALAGRTTVACRQCQT